MSARIGRLVMGGVQSIALHEQDHQTGQLLLKHWNTPSRVYWLIDGGDLLSLDDSYDDPRRATRAAPPEPPINHPDNAWPFTPTDQCAYLYWHDTWWQRAVQPDGTWADDAWNPIEERAA